MKAAAVDKPLNGLVKHKLKAQFMELRISKAIRAEPLNHGPLKQILEDTPSPNRCP
jgi:hypothetical protein